MVIFLKDIQGKLEILGELRRIKEGVSDRNIATYEFLSFYLRSHLSDEVLKTPTYKLPIYKPMSLIDEVSVDVHPTVGEIRFNFNKTIFRKTGFLSLLMQGGFSVEKCSDVNIVFSKSVVDSVGLRDKHFLQKISLTEGVLKIKVHNPSSFSVFFIEDFSSYEIEGLNAFDLKNNKENAIFNAIVEVFGNIIEEYKFNIKKLELKIYYSPSVYSKV